jgi:hypothetical protein
MMRLSVMWNVDRTIAASGSSPVAEQILDRWPHDPGVSTVLSVERELSVRLALRREAPLPALHGEF